VEVLEHRKVCALKVVDVLPGSDEGLLDGAPR
jgi:hypothetical protein